MRGIQTVAIVTFLGFVVFLNTSCGKSKNVEKAEEYMADGLFDEAINLLELEVKAEPTNADAHYLLGEAYLFKGRESKAEASFDKAILLETAYKNKQGETYLKVGMRKLEEGELESSRKLLRQAKELSPELASEIAKWFYEKGRKFADKGESSQRVIEYMSMSNEWDPAYREEIVTYCYKKAAEMMERELFEDANHYAQFSIQTDPAYIDRVQQMYAGITEIYIKREDEEQANRYLSILAQMDNTKRLVHDLETKIGAITIKKLDSSFVRIPAGRFTMGSPVGEEGRIRDELQHEVTISSPFYLQKTEVTQGLWVAVMGSNPSNFQNGNDHPVESVSWYDVQEFLEELNARDPGKNYRLPTEAEWEAARGTDGRIYPWGDQTPDAKRCNFDGQVKTTTPVGRYSPAGDSPYGCVDMAGNVWELCADWSDEFGALSLSFLLSNASKLGADRCDSNNDPKSTTTCPTCPIGPPIGDPRFMRGGAWFYDTDDVRAALRDWCPSDSAAP